MADGPNKILVRMLERLFAGLINGPSLNCRPHASRQRLDFLQLGKLRDQGPDEALQQLLGDARGVKLTARVEAPARPRRSSTRTGKEADAPEPELSPEERAALQAWQEQQACLRKLHLLADEARTYEQDTGVHALYVGLPLLSLPPGSGSFRGRRGAARRVLAPVAFVPVTVTVRTGARPMVEIACRGDEVDRVVPNTALFAWLEQQTGQALSEGAAAASDAAPWREIAALVRQVASALGLEAPAPFAALPTHEPGEGEASAAEPPLHLGPAPRADEEGARPAIVPAAVLGLFPMNNQGLLRDLQAMVAGEALDGPVQSFLQAGVCFDEPPAITYEHTAWSGTKRPRVFAEERAITAADPCQTRAARLARSCAGLVIHGPPGTGKSQTITNIIGDHLSRGERVLFVCDKRTALDVVANRLEHLGLGQLCAVVHDPRQDQRQLYRSLRDQLDGLTDVTTHSRSEKKLERLDAELQQLHAELSEHWQLLHGREAPDDPSFHELAGRWLSTPDACELDPALVRGSTPAQLERLEADLQELLVRAQGVQYATSPWARVVGIGLAAFLARPLEQVRAALAGCVEAARAADATLDAAMPPFAAQPGLEAQAQARAALAVELRRLCTEADAALLARWARQDEAAVRRARQQLREAEPYLQQLRAGPLPTELALLARTDQRSLSTVVSQLAVLDAYLETTETWYGFVWWQRRAQAAELLARHGLRPGVTAARQLHAFLVGLRARLVLRALRRELRGEDLAVDDGTADDVLERSLSQMAALLDLLERVRTDAALAGLAEAVVRALQDPQAAAPTVAGLERSSARAAALGQLRERLLAADLFEAAWLARTLDDLAAGQSVTDLLEGLRASLGDLEDVLRVRAAAAELPTALRPAVEALLVRGATVEDGLNALRRAVLAHELAERLRTQPPLQSLDRLRLQSYHERYRQLEATKQQLVREVVQHRWVSRQQERLLVRTGSRLSSLGADVRRRLLLSGEKALRLRQVVAIGQEIEGGDPLFDLRPLWLASPETVAQVFPRQPLFDVVIFDEASQCRLEEALPVLTRARRVVIAGDPRQLPPTRFFESAVVASDDQELETDQDLFEAQQGEVEDLLTAALSLNIQQCYLDVHYRSRNADLIAFSNAQFYESRLQPIPGHPAHRARFAPLTLYRAGGIYQERTNLAEALQVCEIVRDLLRRAAPPSIGIACFNLPQRDLIVEKLEEQARDDREFAARLAEARTRRGAGSFEGLFVKNLESVQGDERDHIIISTTYGPDVEGRFRRRFGPLGQAGGGRRLNVLVTRAREEVHLVTSIPPSVYRSLPPVPPGRTPGGGWLLFAYLAYAEALAEAYEALHAAEAEGGAARALAVQVRPSRTPSAFAEALARHLARQQGIGSDVHWGNDGFCVDLALHHPQRGDEVTVGVLCDGSRFAAADDPVEWDVFRTAMLEGQGWQLLRLGTPQFFRDPQGSLQAVRRAAEEALQREEDRDAIRVTRKADSEAR